MGRHDLANTSYILIIMMVLLYDEVMSIPANSARHVAGWLACAVLAPGSAGVRRHVGAYRQGSGRVGGRAGAGGQGSASGD